MPKIDVVGVAIGAVSPIRVVVALEVVVVAVVTVVVIDNVVEVVIGIVFDISDVVGTCCK